MGYKTIWVPCPFGQHRTHEYKQQLMKTTRPGDLWRDVICLFVYSPLLISGLFLSFQNIKTWSSIILEMNPLQKSILCFFLLSGLFVFLPEIGRKKKEWSMKDGKIERMEKPPLNNIRWRASKMTQWGKGACLPSMMTWIQLPGLTRWTARIDSCHACAQACMFSLPAPYTHKIN